MHFRPLALMLATLLALAGLGSLTRGPVSSAAALIEREFEIYATDGWTTMPDGERIYIWGFSDKNEKGSATLPGPTITVNEGDRVRITLHNLGFAHSQVKPNHTIHLHGLDVDQANDGVGHTSHEVAAGESFTYEFTATHAGTYWYHCHVDPTEHIQMGMYGAIVVQAEGGAKTAWTGGPAYDREVTLVLSEIDPVWHKSVADRKPYDRTLFHPRYWLINGKAAPDLLSDLSSVIQGEVGERILVRLINAGYQWHAMHMHGFHFDVIASDGRPMPFAWSKDTLSIAPAERYDLLVTLNQKGAFPFHDHNEIAVTNNGEAGGGMHTMVYSGVPVPGPSPHSGHSRNTPAPAPAPKPAPAPAPAPAQAPAEGDVTIALRSAVFQPSVITIKAGAAVTWVNHSLQTHIINGDGWSSGMLGYRGRFSRIFEKPGTYQVWCDLHPAMISQITVVP